MDQYLKLLTSRRALYAAVALTALYVLSSIVLAGEEYSIDLNDGPGTKGFGITRGGTGLTGFQKNKRIGGLPPSARRAYEDKDSLVYDDYSVDSFSEEDSEVFSREKNRIVIILGANLEGGVNKWKGPNEWSIERSSIWNKKTYASLHGYDLVIKDYTKAKKYSNDHREGWQKFDILKEVMDEYNNGDWFWYLDLHTLIMEPQLRIEDLIFANLNDTVTRDLLYFNPNSLQLDIPFTNYDEPINMILSQDCGGFNLHSFLIKKTSWSLTLIDTLFDPIVYLKKHTTWRNDEKNALEHYYDNFGWVRSRMGFIPTKLISSLPKGACPDYKNDQRFFYNETTRDFVVDMVGCDFNRNCWDEMEHFKQLSIDLHKNWFKKLIS
jgi:mannan polymerase II complex MNN10 subunit